MKKITLLLFSAAVLTTLAGCCTQKAQEALPTVTVVKAAPGEIVFDGKASEKFWAKVPAYDLVRCDKVVPPREAARILADGLEKCTVKFAYDDKYFYAAATMEDNDIIAKGKTGDLSILFGDTMEVFLAPEKAFHYWELYSTPNGAKTAFFYELPSLDLKIRNRDKYGILPGFEIACSINGTLNKQSDKDKSWTTEMRLPLALIARHGVKFTPGEKWRVLAARYNYSAYNYAVQTSCYPALPKWNFHTKEYYARVIFR